MKKTLCLTALALLAAHLASAQFIITESPGLFDLSFRGLANTTWYGWGSGSFDGLTNDELIDNPAPSFGTTPSGMSFNQATSFDILSAGNNIYTSTAGATDLWLGIPTLGTVGSGYTTIIIQGKTAFGGYDTPPVFNSIGGVDAIFALGNNAAGSGQFWAKYEIAGNLASYDLAITLGNASFISVAELEVDTYWSATGFAADTAMVPEPSSFALLGVGAVAGLAWKRRSGKTA